MGSGVFMLAMNVGNAIHRRRRKKRGEETVAKATRKYYRKAKRGLGVGRAKRKTVGVSRSGRVYRRDGRGRFN